MTNTRWLFVTMLAGAAVSGPQLALSQAPDRSGKEVVEGICIKCHGTGEKGAPKIGDRAAWNPRLKNGIENTVRSAIRGHGAMPARGGTAGLTDGEMRAAVTYMIDPSSATPRKPQASAPAMKDSMHKLVGGTDVYLGVLPAETMRKRQGAGKAPLEIPSGKGYYHLSVVLRDNGTKAEIKDARVEARVANLMTGETKKLESVTYNDAASYANYFQMPGKDPYTVTLKITKPGAAAPIEARFDLKR